MKPALRLWGDNTAKWEHDGKLYCIHIQRDDNSESPRDWDNLATMACWHSRYNLGDKIEAKEPEDFWRHLVLEYVSREEVESAAFDGKFGGIRVTENEEEPGTYDIYEVCYLAGFQTSREAQEYLEYSKVSRAYLADYLLDDLTIGHCMMLMEPYAEWLPLWLYDHGGITMSCGSRTGQYANRWDSGQVGWIILSKKRIFKECGGITEENWRERAMKYMEGEVETYDQYLTGDVYGFTLYEADPPEDDGPSWKEIDSCWGFYGNDVYENGIADQAGHSFMEAIENGSYKTGEARLRTVNYYTF